MIWGHLVHKYICESPFNAEQYNKGFGAEKNPDDIFFSDGFAYFS